MHVHTGRLDHHLPTDILQLEIASRQHEVVVLCTVQLYKARLKYVALLLQGLEVGLDVVVVLTCKRNNAAVIVLYSTNR